MTLSRGSGISLVVVILACEPRVSPDSDGGTAASTSSSSAASSSSSASSSSGGGVEDAGFLGDGVEVSSIRRSAAGCGPDTPDDDDGGVRWARTLSADNDDQAIAVAVADDDRVVVAGVFRDGMSVADGMLQPHGRHTVYVAQLCSDGAPEWAVSVGGSLQTIEADVVMDRNGRAVVAGTSSDSTDAFGDEFNFSCCWDQGFIVAFAPDGSVAWSRNLLHPSANRINAVAARDDGGVCVAGSFYGALQTGTELIWTVGTMDGFVACYDATGEPQWAWQVGGNSYAGLTGVAAGPGDSLIVAGSFDGFIRVGEHRLEADSSVFPSQDGFVAGLSSDGDVLWALGISGAGAETVMALAGNATGAVIIGRHETAIHAGELEVPDGAGTFLLSIHADGTPRFLRSYPGAFVNMDFHRSVDVALADDGVITLVGRAESLDFGGGSGPIVTRLDATGAHLTTIPLDIANGGPLTAATAPNGDLVIGGAFASSWSLEGVTLMGHVDGMQDSFIARLRVAP